MKQLERRAAGEQPPDQESVPRKPRVWGIVRSVMFLAALVGLALWMNRRPAPPTVLSVMPATAFDDAFRPIEVVDAYGPEDTFFISVELEGYDSSMELIARWLYEGQLITETTLATADSGVGYAGFVLRTEYPPWPAGRYTVEIVYEGEVLGSAAFRVEP